MLHINQSFRLSGKCEACFKNSSPKLPIQSHERVHLQVLKGLSENHPFLPTTPWAENLQRQVHTQQGICQSSDWLTTFLKFMLISFVQWNHWQKTTTPTDCPSCNRDIPQPKLFVGQRSVKPGRWGRVGGNADRTVHASLILPLLLGKCLSAQEGAMPLKATFLVNLWLHISVEKFMLFSLVQSPKREAWDIWCLPPSCLESHGCHLIPLYYLLPLLFLSWLSSAYWPILVTFFFQNRLFGMALV